MRRFIKTKNPCGLRHAIERAGPSFVKIAQWASQRPDLVGKDLCDALEPLTDRHPEHSWEETLEILEELEDSVRISLIQNMDPVPVESGSVAQVYKSKLLLDGEMVDVAVKVLHPDIRPALWAGSLVVSTVSKLFSIPLDWSGFQKSIMRQTDLRMEADNLIRFHENFDHLACVVFPQVILVTPSVLVETFEQGETWETFGKKNPDFHDECVLLRMACFWKMGFHDNFLHSDMHRGNLLYRLDETGAGLQVVFLDAGVVSSMDDEVLLKDFLNVLFAFRMEGMARIMIRCNMNPDADLF